MANVGGTRGNPGEHWFSRLMIWSLAIEFVGL